MNIFDEVDENLFRPLTGTNKIKYVDILALIWEKPGEYEDEDNLAIHYKVVPILKSFQEIISPTIITYKGKLFKIYSMFEHISEQGSPYEGVLKEAS